MDIQTYVLTEKFILACLLIIGGFYALRTGFKLYISGVGLSADGSSIEHKNAKAHLKTVGSVVMITSVAWGFMGYLASPDFKSAGGTIEITSKDETSKGDLHETVIAANLPDNISKTPVSNTKIADAFNKNVNKDKYVRNKTMQVARVSAADENNHKPIKNNISPDNATITEIMAGNIYIDKNTEEMPLYIKSNEQIMPNETVVALNKSALDNDEKFSIKVGKDYVVNSQTSAINTLALGEHARADVNIGGSQVENANVDIGRDYKVDVKTDEVNAVALGKNVSARINVGNIRQGDQYLEKSKTKQEVTVLEGDTLYTISKRVFGDENKWYLIYEANRNIIDDINKIVPGMILKIPAL